MCVGANTSINLQSLQQPHERFSLTEVLERVSGHKMSGQRFPSNIKESLKISLENIL